MSNSKESASQQGKGEEESKQNNQGEMPSYYKKDVQVQLDHNMHKILREYSGLSKEELGPHLHAARNKAWAAAPWPCIGQWSFLKLRLPAHPEYERIVKEAKSAKPGSYLFCDVGTGLGQELRGLAAAGVPSKNLCAIDLNDALWNCGFDLFRDKEKMSDAAFAAGNILDISKEPLVSWIGSLDVIWAGLFLHCFDWDGQVTAAKSLTDLCKKRNGALIVGWQLAGPGVHAPAPSAPTKKLFLHNAQSFKKMWNLVGEKTGDSFSIWAKQIPLPKSVTGLGPAFTDMLIFTVTRKLNKR